MTTAEIIAREVGKVRDYALGLAQRVVFYTRVSATSADGSTDGVEGWPTSDGDPAGQQPALRGEPWGVHGRPMAGVQALVSRVMAGVASGVITAIWTNAHGRQNLEPGETQLYNKVSGCEVFLDKNGNVIIGVPLSKLIQLAGTSDFVLKGNTYRTAEDVMLALIQSAFTAAATGFTNLGQAPAAAACTAAATGIGTFTTAASNYLSTKVKVG